MLRKLGALNPEMEFLIKNVYLLGCHLQETACYEKCTGMYLDFVNIMYLENSNVLGNVLKCTGIWDENWVATLWSQLFYDWSGWSGLFCDWPGWSGLFYDWSGVIGAVLWLVRDGQGCFMISWGGQGCFGQALLVELSFSFLRWCVISTASLGSNLIGRRNSNRWLSTFSLR